MSENNEQIEQEATSQGWVPKEKYRGNETDWVDAATFVKRGKEIMPILRKNNETLLKKLEARDEEIKEIRKTTEDFKKFQTESNERKVRELTSQLEQLKTLRAQAITDSDGAKVNAVDDAIDEVKGQVKAVKEEVDAAKAAKPVTATKVLDPILKEWMDDNSWFGTDEALTDYTTKIGERIRKEHPALIGKDYLDKLDETLAEEGPAKLRKKGKPLNPVESGAGKGRTGDTSKHSFENLPKEAQDACNRFIKQGIMKDKKEYLEMYDWSE